MRTPAIAAVAALCLTAACTRPQDSGSYVASSLESELRTISAIDNHAHPVAVTGSGEQDQDYDALSMEGIEDMAMPTPFRSGSPYFAQAWQALYGVSDAGDRRT